MRKNFLLFTFIILSSILGYSQNSIDTVYPLKKQGIILFYPFQLLAGEVRLGYEQSILKKVSIEISPGYLFGIIQGEIDGDIGIEGKNNLNTNFKGYAMRAGARYYLSSNYNGFYVHPLFLYKHADSETNTFDYPYTPATEDVNIYALQLLLGTRFKSRKKLCFDLYAGIGYKKTYDSYDFNQPNIPNNIGTDKAAYFTLQLGCAIGYMIFKK